MEAILQVPMEYRYTLTGARAEELCDRVRELREAEVSYPSIAVVMAIYEGILVNGDDVRSWCGRMGLPKNPNKARPPRAIAA